VNEDVMSQTTLGRTGAPGSAYVALTLGLLAVGSFAFPPAPVIAGACGVAASLHARRLVRQSGTAAGTVPSLAGAILSAFGLASALPWVFAVILTVVAR
jgi:hypothetical protein